MNIDPKKVNKVRSAREQLGLSQAEFAQKLGVTRTYVSQLEQGREPSRSLESLIDRILEEKTSLKEDEVMYRAVNSTSSQSAHQATLLMQYLGDAIDRGINAVQNGDMRAVTESLHAAKTLWKALLGGK